MKFSSLVYTPTTHKTRRRALRALFSDKSLQVRGLFLVNKSKEASTCRREAAALTVQWLPRDSLDKLMQEERAHFRVDAIRRRKRGPFLSF